VPSFCRAAGKESGESLLGKVTIEEYTTHQGLLHGDLAKRAKHFFTESARVCAGTQNSVCLFCLHIAPYIKSSQLFRKQESDVNGMEAGWHRY
jgi:hypothetical protein